MNWQTDDTVTQEQRDEMRAWLKGHLYHGEVTVTFKKVDGTERVMRCTTCPDLLPPVPEVEVDPDAPPKKERKENPDVARVYDLDKGDWRSFRFDSITEISFVIGE